MTLQHNEWPTHANMRSFYGEYGEGITRLVLPYRMYLTWDLEKSVKSISIHEKCAVSAERVLRHIYEIYGPDRIRELHLDRFSGCLADPPRAMRKGRKPSTHNWAAAIDFADTENQLEWGSDKALFARPEYIPFWEAWEAEGWVSLGRQKDYDWMHIQAVRL